MWSRKRNSHSRQGFTLIELLVTSALSLVLLGGSLFSYNRYQVRQAQSATGKLVVSLLREARNRSAAGDKPAEDCATLLGYRVRAVRNTNRYFLSVRCSSGVELELQEFLLAENYVFLNSEFDVMYTPQAGPVSGSDIVVNVGKSPPETSSVYRFRILTSGAVQEEGIVQP